MTSIYAECSQTYHKLYEVAVHPFVTKKAPFVEGSGLLCEKASIWRRQRPEIKLKVKRGHTAK